MSVRYGHWQPLSNDTMFVVMTSYSPSGMAGRRIREARQQLGMTVRELAGECAKLGAPQLTTSVITNLETRRKATRDISVDELLAIARALGVRPLQLMVPLEAGERLGVAGGELDAPEAIAWIAGDPQGDLLHWTAVPQPEYTPRVLRRGDQGTVLTTIRQVALVARQIAQYDEALTDPGFRGKHPAAAEAYERESLPVMADRLMHLVARMEAAGHEAPGLDAAREILERHGLPATLEQWRALAAAGEEDDDEPGT